MKKVVPLIMLFISSVTFAQEVKQIPQINVNGEGKIKVVPDQAKILVSVQTKGTDAKTVKKQNDQKIEAVVKFIKKMNIPTTDYKTQRVSLNPQYDYEKKKHNYNAVQSIEILLKDLGKYDELMEGLVDEGINTIDNVTFESSKMAQHEVEARKLAMKDAKAKAEDYVSVLNQKLGKALLINDNSQIYRPAPPVMYARMAKAESADAAPRETLAMGEIEIVANVSVSFILE